MKKNSEKSFSDFSSKLSQEVNFTFKYGSLFMIIFSVLNLILFIIFKITRPSLSYIGAALILLFVFSSFFIYFLARLNKLKGVLQYIVVVFLNSLPFLSLITVIIRYPTESVPFAISVPFIFLIFDIIIITGFFFDTKISILSGIIAAIGYYIIFLLSRQYYLESFIQDQRIEQILSFRYNIIKSLFICLAGVLVGLLSANTKRLIKNFLNEEKEKLTINRLFGQYVSNEVKDKVISEQRDKIAERKKVVVLFSDIRSFTELSEKCKPEIIVKQLNMYFNSMVFCISQFQGSIDKFIGDAIMAVFGGLIEIENPCDAALLAALMMHEELKKINIEFKNKYMQEFISGIGMHFGEVVQGTIGSENRKDFTVIGDTVNIAARLEKLTKEYGKILFSDSFYQNLSENFKNDSKQIGKINLKGIKKPVVIYTYNIIGAG